jgi:hypothetical protein
MKKTPRGVLINVFAIGNHPFALVELGIGLPSVFFVVAENDVILLSFYVVDFKLFHFYCPFPFFL